MDNANEQAFPIPSDEDHVRVYGLTKREYFAAMAMQGFMSNFDGSSKEWYAREAVKHADALLAELAKS